MKNVILYTVCVGGYDRVQPRVKELGLTHIIFSDLSPRQIPAPWVKLPMPPRPENFPLSLRRWSRLLKLCPHKYLPPHDVSIYADCNLQWSTVPVKKWALEQVANHSMAVCKHPGRTCVYQEFETCRQLAFDYPQNLGPHEAELRRQGFPEQWGLTENCFIIRRNDAETNRFNEAWFADYMAGSMRDQLSFMPAVWRTGFRSKLNIMPKNSRRNQFYTQVRHLKDRRVKVEGAS